LVYRPAFEYSAGNVSAASAALNVTIDTVRPTVLSTVPTNGATGVAPAANLSARFSEPMQASTINNTNVRLVRNGTTVQVGKVVSYNATNRMVTINPNRNLVRRARYTATITTGVRDVAGNPLAVAKVWSFKVS
jgi:hypothetical protein